MQVGSKTDELRPPGDAETWLANRDPVLGLVIAAQNERWTGIRNEDPIWGLVRIVIAQQISPKIACERADRLKLSFTTITSPQRCTFPNSTELRALGLPERRAKTCVEIFARADEITEKVRLGATWEAALQGIKGIGPWTISTFRIFVLRELDVLPLGDVGLERAVRNVYGNVHRVEKIGETWRPFRSVACWYLWRTLGNKQLG